MNYRIERIPQEPLSADKVKLAVAVAATLYFLWAALHPDSWRLIDGVNLVIHEAGHVVFSPFGQFLAVAGGSLFQVIVPVVFAGYFYFSRKPYSCALVLFWAGESLLNVSVYAADSIAMQLPLLGGDNSIHDWNFMLDRLGLLHQTARIAFALRALGTLLIISAALWAILTALRPAKSEFER
ncbi:MAG TPA: hypothetical protein VJT74_07040 [Pyrinomonadaceae bacterium]|nr:hypothetical protein [Pyrinomonadaceae bacterium]